MQMRGIPRLPLLSVAELLMSPVMKEDSCFLTVSFHIRRIRLCEGKKGAGDKEAGDGEKKKIQIEAGKDRMGKGRKREEEEEAKIKVGERIKGRNHNEGR